MSFTFKNQPKETGLAGICSPFQSVDIKYNKKVCGVISAPNWKTKDNCYCIQLAVLKSQDEDIGNCNWKWVTAKFKSDDVNECKKYLQDNFDKIISTYTLCFLD